MSESPKKYLKLTKGPGHRMDFIQEVLKREEGGYHLNSRQFCRNTWGQVVTKTTCFIRNLEMSCKIMDIPISLADGTRVTMSTWQLLVLNMNNHTLQTALNFLLIENPRASKLISETLTEKKLSFQLTFLTNMVKFDSSHSCSMI